MGKRHKRRRMVNKLAPHRGSVILTKPVSLPTAMELQAELQRWGTPKSGPMSDAGLALAYLAAAISPPPMAKGDRNRLRKMMS